MGVWGAGIESFIVDRCIGTLETTCYVVNDKLISLTTR